MKRIGFISFRALALMATPCLVLSGCVFNAKFNTDAMPMSEVETQSKPKVWDIRDAKMAFDYLQSEGFNSFPTYFFYDRDHNLVHKQTAFPGKEKYRDLLREIKREK